VRVDNLKQVESFVTLDGSEIRELAGVPAGNSANQSLAQATVPPGAIGPPERNCDAIS